VTDRIDRYIQPPAQYFAARFSQFDAEGNPSHDKEGVQLSNAARKSAAKDRGQYIKEHTDLMSKIAADPQYVDKARANVAALKAELAKLS